MLNILVYSAVSNMFEIFTVVSCILYIIIPLVLDASVAGVHLGAIAIFSAWFNFTLLLGKLPVTGIYIQVINEFWFHTLISLQHMYFLTWKNYLLYLMIITDGGWNWSRCIEISCIIRIDLNSVCTMFSRRK